MARRSSFDVKINVREIEGLAGRLDRVTGARLSRAAVDAVNDVIVKFDESSRKAANAGINLTDAYLLRKRDLVLAKTPEAKAEIVTWGPGRANRAGLTILGHYDPIVLTAPAKGSARGDPKRGVPPGRKAAGVRVTVKPNAPRDLLPGAFTMTLRRGAVAGGQVGVFTRHNGRLKHRYGVSPYSLFRYQLETRGDQVTADLETRGAAAIADAVGRELA